MIDDLAKFCVERGKTVRMTKADRGLVHATLALYRETRRKDGETEDVADLRLIATDPLFFALYKIATEPDDGAMPRFPFLGQEAL